MLEKSFELIFHEHNKMIVSYLYSLVGNRQDAADLAQETFVIAYRKMDQFSPEKSVAAWLRGIAKNLARNSIRKVYRHREVLLEGNTIENLFEGLERQAGTEKWESSLAGLEKCMEKLPEKQRQAIDMHYLSEKSAKNISESMGVLERSIFQLLWQARNNLKNCVRSLLKATGKEDDE
ncbi:MAG: hypothetical protein C0404_13260 [Verrucomicrobia bacterium]|nr:hypothetical protein [Verrucomicrobiota bacterium]